MKQTHSRQCPFDDINAFINAGVGDQPDDEGLVKLDSKWQWHSVARRAADVFGEDWREYLIQYVGVVLPSAGEVPHSFLTILADGRVIQVRRVRIFHGLTRAYIDIRYAPTNKRTIRGEVSVENVQHLKTWPAFQREVQPLWRGLALRGLIDKQRGRKPRHTDARKFWEESIEVHLALFEEHKQRSPYDPLYKYSQQAIAQRMGYSTSKEWREAADRLGVDRDELKQRALDAQPHF